MTHKFVGFPNTPVAVAFELNFGNPLSSEIEAYCAQQEKLLKLVRREKTITRLYVPHIRSINQKEILFVIFESSLRPQACFTRLMFRRNQNIHPTPWMTAARFGETKCFSFSLNKVLQRGKLMDWKHHLPLSYPGRNGVFQPVFFKTEHENGEFSYLQVRAVDDESGKTVLRVTHEKEENTPPHLQIAVP